MNTAFLGLGSNLGDRQRYLSEALRLLAADPAIVVARGSSVYESKPVGVIEQPDFLNLVAQIETTHAPLALLSSCLAVESALKRERRERWGPRFIDIDILVYGDLVQLDDRLVLPHPRMHERSFVLTPLAEIAPDLMLKEVAIRDLAAQVGSEGLRRCAHWSELFGASRALSAP